METIKGSEGNNDYVCVAKSSGVKLGVKIFAQGVDPTAHGIVARIRSTRDHSDTVAMTNSKHMFTNMWPKIQKWGKVAPTHASTHFMDMHVADCSLEDWSNKSIPNNI